MDALEDAYIKDNKGTQRFTVTDFNNYKIIDNISINDQIHQFQNYINEIHRSGSVLDENYQIFCLIEKLPPFWSKFTQELRRIQRTLGLKSVI